MDQPKRAIGDQLPCEPRPPTETVRERAARLAQAARRRESRAEFLESMRGVERSREQVRDLFRYIETEVRAIAETDPSLGISFHSREGDLILVRTAKASFTIHWGQQFSNTLRYARLFIREFNLAHTLGVFGKKHRPVREVYTHFDVDEALNPSWREEDAPDIVYSTRQLADKYLGRVLERAYGADEAETDDEWDDE